MDDALRYPTGKWGKVDGLDAAGRAGLIEHIAAVPTCLRAAIAGLDNTQLDTPYRSGGWTPRQIVHHLADSHLNAFARVKLGVTEDNPTIKAYDEKAWAETPDARLAPAELSLSILDGVHARWALLLSALDDATFERTVEHPEQGTMTLGDVLQLYAWHGRHHTVQITALRSRMGW
jgi:uncharacterized damage-inducible protein DinB